MRRRPLAAPPPTLLACPAGRARSCGPSATARSPPSGTGPTGCNGGGVYPSPQRPAVGEAGRPASLMARLQTWLRLNPRLCIAQSLRAPCGAGVREDGWRLVRDEVRREGCRADGSGGSRRGRAGGVRELPRSAPARPRERRRISGRKRSDLWAPRYHHPTVLVGLILPREELHRRINTRPGRCPGREPCRKRPPAGRAPRWPRRAGSGARHVRAIALIIAEHLAEACGYDEVEGRLAAATCGYARRQLTGCARCRALLSSGRLRERSGCGGRGYPRACPGAQRAVE